jgi:acyl-CoA-binding protein
MDIKARAKYDAWAAIAGMPAEEAMQDYVDLVESLH